MKLPYLQEAIHKLEVGPGLRYLRIGLALLALGLLLVGYNWRSFRNMAGAEAMDAAQVGRNLAEGKGYTTLFVRPLSVHLVKKRAEAKGGGVDGDAAQLKGMHPDLANPPVYPCLLAGLMKVLPFHWPIEGTKPFWTKDGQFWRYQPDFLIALFNEGVFFCVIALTFLLARRLFDDGVAWLSGILLLCCEQLWRFSTSGLSTMVLMLIFMGLIWCVVFIEREAREPKWGQGRLFLLTGAAAVLLALGTLTRYSFGWLLLPLLVFFILFGGPRRAAHCLLAVAVFLILMGPWVYRVYNLSGTPFGTASFAALEGTGIFPEHRLERSLKPDFTVVYLTPFIYKLIANARQILVSDLPRLGGTWLTPLFLAGLLLGFREVARRRLRYFVVICLAALVVVQAMGRTQLSEDTPELNSENLLVLLVPLVMIYGISLFYLLLDQMSLLWKGLRYGVVVLFGVIMCLPMFFTFLPPKPVPVVYPPYNPPLIQRTAGWMKENELLMSDMPWAVAWYGRRQCMWLTLNAQDEFFAVNDLLKPIRGLYLSPQTMDSRFLSQWIRAGEHSWGSFILESMMRREIPPAFPLRKSPGFLPEHLFLSDMDRWSKTPGQ